MTIAAPSGYDLRAATPDEIPEIARFIVDHDLEIGGYSDFTEADLREIANRTSIFDIDKGTWIVRDGDDIAAFAIMWDSGPGIVFQSIGLVDQSHIGRGLGALLIDCLEARARERQPREEEDVMVTLRNSVDVKDPAGRQLLKSRGYKMVRLHYTMRVMLDRDVASDIPPGVRIRTCALGDAPLLYRLIEETFAGHWGRSSSTYEEWSSALLSRDDSDPSMWFIAEVKEEPVGLLLGSGDGDRGWVATLGVVAGWRRHGIGGALLRHAFADFKRRGFTEAGLEVDVGNETGAVRVYERAGMEPVRIYETYEKQFPG